MWMVLSIYAIILTAVLLVRLAKTKQLTVLYPVALIVFAVILWVVTPLHSASAYLRLFIEESGYREAIEAIAMGNDSPCEKLHCIVEDKEKVQVAFVWDGIIDNWHGICHDPTATVLKANILKSDWSNRNDPEYSKAARMFEGVMIRAVHLWGDWYLCSFT